MWRAVSSSGDRLPQGYTNRTRFVPGTAIIEKVYAGSDARIRLDREERCLTWVGSIVPVPSVVGRDEERRALRLECIDGIPGQLLLDGHSADRVLTAAGSLLRLLQRDASPLLAPALQGVGPVVVHGDYGPQNLLIDADFAVVGLLDWEFAHIGDPVEDLAWAEWIVRMHHPDAIDSLDGLFTGYEARPAWSERRTAMLVQCEFLRQRCETDGLRDAEVMWRDRARTTERWTE
jgi:aminoglycoside phosphotransferase